LLYPTRAIGHYLLYHYPMARRYARWRIHLVNLLLGYGHDGMWRIRSRRS
jgi:hypothetical protein